MATTLQEIKKKYLDGALSRPISKYSLKDRNGKIVVECNSQTHHAFTNAEDEAYAREHYEVSEKFKAPDGRMVTFWKLNESEAGLFRSADGNYYTTDALPENDSAFCIERYKAEIKGERNARIADTDDYVKLTDITIQESAGAKRVAMSEATKSELLAYRQALRDLPTVAGFPFVEFPAYPTALAYELENKATNRKMMNERFK